MQIIQSRRARHVIVRLDRGEELPSALLRALDAAEVKAGWISGTGALEAVEIALFDQQARRYGKPRRIEGQAEIVHLSGSIAVEDGAGSLRLSATLARETDVGLTMAAGQIVWGRAFAVELHVVAFDDAVLVRVPDERTTLSLLQAGSTSVIPASSAREPQEAGAPPPAPAAVAPAAPPPAAVHAPAPVPAAVHSPPPTASFEPSRPPAYTPPPATEQAPQSPQTPMPARLFRAQEEVEFYPEPGDHVNHFHFGECEVILSDGDRIRLRQDKDGRVREVALGMLKIERPTIDPSTGKRDFKLARKN